MFGLNTEIVLLFLILVQNTYLRPLQNYEAVNELTLSALIIFCFYRQLFKVGLRECFYYTLGPSFMTIALFLIQTFGLRTNVEPQLHHHWVNVAINRIGLVVAFVIYAKYGDGDLSNIKTRGLFKVGYKEFHTKECSNAVSVFYPMDMDTYETT
jgi:hypothetical protein